MKRPRVSSLLFWASTLRMYSKRLRDDELQIGFRRRAALMWHGFTGESLALYQLTSSSRSNYVSDFERLLTARINGPYAIVFDNKLLFERMYSTVISVPKSLALIESGRLLPLSENQISGVDSLMAYLSQNAACVIKPVKGGGGRGFFVLRYTPDGLSINSASSTKADLARLVSSLTDSFVSEFVEQGTFAANLYPGSTNSMRILTMTDPETMTPFAAIAVQKIGSRRSAPLDHFRKGGFSSDIDLATGELGSAAAHPSQLQLEWHDTHPETGARIKGVRVPGWPRILSEILEAAARYPYIKYIGWDAVMTNRGVTVLEGNHYSGLGLLQVHRPLLADPRVRRFYEYHRIIKPLRH